MTRSPISDWKWKAEDTKVFIWTILALIIWIVCFYMLTISSDSVEHKATPEEIEQAQLDTLYQIMVGPDSGSLLNTIKRFKAQMDSICKYEYEGRC